MMMSRHLRMIAIASLAVLTVAAQSAERRELESIYTDANNDLVADTPTDPTKWKSPNTLVFTFTPLEDPAVYEKIFKPFTAHLAQCTGRRTAFFSVQSNSAQIEAMRSGRLHLAFFAAGTTNFAVNIAGAVPFAIRADDKGPHGYNLVLLVRKDSTIQKLADLKGKKVAHTSPSSASGNSAPRALFPALGITPEKDYQVVYSGKHDQSVMGVKSGDYDAAPVASDVFHQMARRGVIKESDFRIIYTSERFPVNALAYAHDLEPSLRDKIVKCVYGYKFDASLSEAMEGATHFAPVDYKKDWALLRKIAAEAGESLGRTAYDKEKARESAAPKAP